MGKKDQRTKGNTKSASSSRSAQILGNSTSFVGFGTSAESAFVPILQGAENDDGVPADFRLVLRKMHKKDVTTKVKALQEFQELAEKVVKSEDCSTASITEPSSEMLAVLPFWPAVYTKLAIDTDRRVRELSHLCLNLVVRGVGKQLATQLRSMAGVWFLAMTDPHLPAAQTAMTAWQTAFPTVQKQTNAVAYCQTEIFSSITDNITTATPQTLSDPKVTPVEEMESKYVRTLSMSLSSLARLVIEIEKSSSCSSTLPAITPLLDHPKFWKLAKHKVGSVRQAFFETIVQIGSSLPSLLETKGPSLVTCTLGSGLQETDPGAAPAVWAAALQVLRLLPEAWDLVSSPHKSVFPSVFKFIESGVGGGGIAHSTFPSLLPFLSKVPASVMGDQAKFLHRWFSCFRESLDSQSIVKQRISADLRAVVGSYIECLFYCCSKEELDSGLKAGLVTDHLSPLFSRSLEEERLESSRLQEAVMDYLGAWDRQVASKPSVAILNNLFWADLKHRLVTKLDKHAGYEEIQKLLRLFKKVGSKPEYKNIVEMDTLVMSLWNTLVTQLTDDGTVEQICSCLSLILPLLHPGLFNQLFTGPGAEADFLESTVLPLLQQSNHDPAICSLIWGLVSRLEPTRGAEIFTKLCGLHPTVIQHLLVAGGSRAGSSPMVVEWFSLKNTIQWLMDLTTKLVEGDESGLGTLKKILGLRLSLAVSDIERFIQLLSPALEMWGKEDRFISQVQEVSELMVLLLGQDEAGLWESEAGVDILMAIFRLDNGTETACKVQDKLERAWSAGVRLVGRDSRLVRQMVEEMKIQLLLDQKQLQRLIGKGRGLLSSLKGEEDNLKVILALTINWSDLPPPSPESLLKQVVTQQFLLLEPGLPSELELPEAPNLTRVKAAVFLSSLLLQHYSLSIIEEDFSTVSGSDRVKVDSELAPHLTELIFSLCYMERLHSTPDTSSLRDQLDRQVSLLVSHLDKETSQQLVTRVRGSSLQTGGLWADCLGWLVRLQYRTSEWDPRLPGLMPRVDCWSEGELATAVTVLSLSKELGAGCEVVDQTLSVECGRLLSLGGLTNPSSVPLVWLVDHCARLCPQLDRVTEELAAVLGTFPVWRAECEEQLLYSRQLGEVSWSEASTVACVAHLLATTVESSPASLSPSVWDFACCSLVSWCASVEESRECLQTRPAVLMLGVAVCRLARLMGQLLGPLGHHPALAPPPSPVVDAELILPLRLREEWAEFFSEGVYSVLLPVYLAVCNAQSPGKSSQPLEKELCSALVLCPSPLLLSTPLPPLHLVQDVDCTRPLPDSLTFFYNHIGPLLLSPSRHIQVSAAHLLAAAAKETAAADDSSYDGEEEKGLPHRLMEVISAGNTVLETVLQEFKVGESVGDIPPGNIVHIQTRGYLLAWRVVLNLVAAAGPELRPLYSQFLWTGGHLTSLLNHLFRLLPVSVHTTSLDLALFTAPLTVTEQPSSRELVCLAGSCWMSVCRYLPALARMWYKEQDKTAQNVVEGVTSSVVTPVLWSEEARAIQTSGASMENMELRVRGSVREVVATYTIDESSMELVVSLPANHPLDQVGVESGRRVGVETGQWRKWMLQLTTFLTHQNGTILDGLNLWKRNVDKRFEGVEECYICYYILHGSNHQLPKLGCRTCKKKFHSACLYKWFSTSNNSSCPLCRNLF